MAHVTKSQQSGENGVLPDVTWVVLGLTSVFVSLVASFISGDGHWFQRSGSLLVLFSVVLEFRQSQMTKPSVSSDVSINNRPVATSRNTPAFRKWLHYYALLAIVIGTLVWGYGDLLFLYSESGAT